MYLSKLPLNITQYLIVVIVFNISCLELRTFIDYML